ncbi:hypothetical protein BegalDRAFT_2302 [Beggiatoa alba B18LD]|uniref:Uncharacterized protein n=1 Tax=Beggiatoa alba B18LD TaxID=395493 RepID=I3CHR3_9GAMM|nr:hypothetical protein [Beggiatoa alba]EIJ43156.1 hypothetical protein BegalDRAFT_2302 [Beggiatoa alba B18LD]
MYLKAFFVGAIGFCSAQVGWAGEAQTLNTVPQFSAVPQITSRVPSIETELRADIPDFQTFQERTRRHSEDVTVIAAAKKNVKEPV